MDDGSEGNVGRRVGRIAGLYALALVLLRLGRLLQSGPELPRWDLILISATVLGVIVWWLISQTRLNLPLSIYLFGLIALIVFIRVAVPTTLAYAIVPTAETFPTLADVMTSALRVFRSGVPPVYPDTGVIATLAVVMWCLGGVYAFGVTTGRVLVMFLPAGMVYLQFAVFDRRPGGFTWMALAAVGLVLAATAVALDRRDHVGRARDAGGKPKTHRSPTASVAMATVACLSAFLVATSASGIVSEYGNLPWRTGISGSGPGSGGIAFDRFVGLQQRLLSRENALLFQATLGRDAPPGDQLYWRMESLDVFTGVTWRRGGSQVRNYEPGVVLGDPAHAYQGTTETVLQRVYISRLAGDLAPVAGSATSVMALDAEGALPPRSFRMGRDATLYYPAEFLQDDQYQVESQFPVVEADLAALATGSDGELTPLFAAAAEAGVLDLAATPVDREVIRPDDLASFVRLPEDLPPTLRIIATRQTLGATTDFERAWMLQHWFRDSGDFDYSVDVSTGSGALDLAAWLEDPASPNYRTGYCEQFAASMAVLGRLVGIPSRVVWGFTPGTVTTSGSTEVIEVRDTNAHAWVEMWMDGFGWVRFDPTPRGEFQPASVTAGFDPAEYVAETPPDGIDEPVTPPDLAPAPGFVEDPGFDPVVVGGPRWWILIIPALALIFSAIPILKRLRRRRRLARLREGDITAAWDEIVDRLDDLGEPLDPSHTPVEAARATDPALLPLANGYSAAVYGGKVGTGQESDLITMEWWLQTRFDSGQRVRGALNPRSLRGKRG
jgi:transglutaminase-like putative cysteine protease